MFNVPLKSYHCLHEYILHTYTLSPPLPPECTVAPSDIVRLCSSYYKGIIICRARGFFFPAVRFTAHILWPTFPEWTILWPTNHSFRRSISAAQETILSLALVGWYSIFAGWQWQHFFLDVPTPFEKKALCCNIWSRLFCFISIQLIGFVSALFVRVLYGLDLLFHWTKNGIQREYWKQLGPYNNQSLKGVVLVFNHLCWNAAQCLVILGV